MRLKNLQKLIVLVESFEEIGTILNEKKLVYDLVNEKIEKQIGRTRSVVKEVIPLAQVHKILLGINLQTQYKRQKIRQMQHLNLLLKWVSIIFAFMTMI